jgi:hypothetical protein
MSSVDQCNDKWVGAVEKLFNKLNMVQRNQFYKLLTREDIKTYLEDSVGTNTTFAAIKKLCQTTGMPLKHLYQELYRFINYDPVSTGTLLIAEKADDRYARLTKDERNTLINNLIMDPAFLPNNHNAASVTKFRTYMNHNDGNIQIYWVMQQFFKNDTIILEKYRILMEYLSAIRKSRPTPVNTINYGEEVGKVNNNALLTNQLANRRSETAFKYPIMRAFYKTSNMEPFGKVGELPPPQENRPSAKRQRTAGGSKKRNQRKSRTTRASKHGLVRKSLHLRTTKKRN